MSYWRYDPKDYAVGSPLYVQSGYGMVSDIRPYTVTAITPKGQVTAADANGSVLRVTAKGRIVGSQSWDGRRIVSAEREKETRLARQERDAFRAIRDVAEMVAEYARLGNRVKLAEGMTALVAAIAALPPESAA